MGKNYIDTVRGHYSKGKTGIVDTSLLERMNPSFWQKYADQIVICLGFVRMPHGSIATRDTLTTRVIDALEYLGTPATKEELAEMCGVSIKQLMSRLWSIENVVKISNNMWALSSAGQPKYVGVVDEMIRLIEDKGGVVALDEFKDRMLRICNVKESTINAFLFTSQFVVEENKVRLCRSEEISLKPVSESMDGRLPSGAPYWLFTVLPRHLRGNSVTGFPPEMANHMNCGPNQTVSMPVFSPPGCRNLSVTWRLSSTNGVQVGFLRDALEKLSVLPGEKMRLVVNFHQIEIQRHI